jgi:dienelactone hydrolase
MANAGCQSLTLRPIFSDKSGTFLAGRGWMLFRSVVNNLTRVLYLVAFLVSSATSRAPDSSAISSRSQGYDGTWVGTVEGKRGPVFVAVRIEQGESAPQISVSIRSQGIVGAKATKTVVEPGRIAFDLRTEVGQNEGEGGANWHFDLRQAGDRLDGQVNRRPDRESSTDSSPGTFGLRLQHALELTVDQFRSFVGDYRLAEKPAEAGAKSEGDVFFVGYGGNATRGNSNYAYVTLGDRFQQIVPIAADTFLADDGARLAFERDAAKQVRRLHWTPPIAALGSAAASETHVAERVELWRQEEVTFQGPGATLSGTAYLPASKGPHPALVFVHGSGPQLRLDNWPMADRFARAGIACLSFDKRGTGNSTGDWQQAGFDVLADDVIAAVDALRDRSDIRADQVGVWGVSQAGWVIPIAANKSDHIAFCIPVSGGAVSPAEQELWRRTQWLQSFGAGSRLVETMRRAVALHFQWEELFKAGKFPIPPLFEMEPLDMYLDAPANIRRVRQPVLAIFGESDVLTPPRESAAIWANQLEDGGNHDYSVRLFPRATHGLLVSDRPFEALSESRLAPGYLRTMVEWIARHTGDHPQSPYTPSNDGQANSPTVAVDVAAGTPDVIESRGLRDLPWYGSAPVQVTLLVVATLGTLWTVALWPIAWSIRKFRRMPRRGPPKRKTIVVASLLNVGALALCGALVALLRFLGDASPSAYYTSTKIDLWILAAMVVPLAWFSALLVCSCIGAIGCRGRSRWESASAWVFAATACLWVFIFMYWTWGPLLS